MFSSPDNERSLTGAAEIFAGAEKQLGIARDFYEEILLPAVQEEDSEMTPDQLRELISSYEKEHETKVNSIALENIAAASIARSELGVILPTEEPSIERQAGRTIQKTFEVPEATFLWKIRLWRESLTKDKVKLPLVLYKEDKLYQLSPPKTIKIGWFFMTVEVPKERDELIDFFEKVRERIGEFYDFEPKQIYINADTLEKEGEYKGVIIYAQLGGEKMFTPGRTPEPPIKIKSPIS